MHGTPKYVSNTGIYFINGNNLESGSIHITNETKEVSKEDSLKNDKQLNSNTILMSININPLRYLAVISTILG